MKLGIIQLSDIHIKSSTDFILDKKEQITNVCCSELTDCSKIILLITGDIAFSGKRNEYELAYDFLKSVEDIIKHRMTYINSFDYVIVPGNHDCCFIEDSIRDIVIEKVLSTGQVDEKIISKCLEPQANFWSFFNRLSNVNFSPSISFKKNIRLTLKDGISFHCYNTSFLSTLHETVGSLIIPTENFLMRDERDENVVITLFHHNTGWISPGRAGNNYKKLFEKHIIDSSDIVMCGHEHCRKQQIISNLNQKESIIYLESGAFQNEKTSEFNILKYDTDSKSIENQKFKYDSSENLYIPVLGNDILNLKKKITGLTLNEEYHNWLNSIDVPIKHHLKEHLNLSDIFVYPDLEPIETFSSKYIQYINSKELIQDDSNGKVLIIEGNSQSGKSSLMKTYFLNYYDKGFYPIMINGTDVKAININEVLKKAFKQQYSDTYTYSKYKQINEDKKIIIIEDFNESKLNDNGKSRLLKDLMKIAKKVIITTKIQNK